MPDLNDLPKEISNVARDAAYVVVGLGVLGLQRAQVQRQDLQKRLQSSQLEDVLGQLRTNVGRSVQSLDQVVEQAINHVETTIEPLEQQLPSGIRDLVGQARSQAREARGQIRTLVQTAV